MRKTQAKALRELLRLLALCSNAEGTNCCPKVGTLAQRLDVSEKTVQRYCRLAEQCGLLTIVERFGGNGGGRRSNQYDVNWQALRHPVKLSGGGRQVDGATRQSDGASPRQVDGASPRQNDGALVISNYSTSAPGRSDSTDLESVDPTPAETAAQDAALLRMWDAMTTPEQVAFLERRNPYLARYHREKPHSRVVRIQVLRFLRGETTTRTTG